MTLHPNELIVDLFAGGGGASQGIFQALGRHPDVAVNHDADAIAVHRRNHPATEHLQASVWHVDPRQVHPERPVGLLWASPDCRHFSRAAGGTPKSKSVRSLPGVVLTWATRRRPRVIVVENVREMLGWGPLLADGTPCPARIGRSWKQWVGRLRGLGYRVEWRELCAADFGAPTIRTRLVVVATADAAPFQWPQPTHARRPSMLERPWRAAAECIDFSDLGRSIFDRPRPLKPATLRRIAEGVTRFVLKAPEPFIVRIGHCSEKSGQGMGFRGQGLGDPLSTVSTINDKALVAAHVSSFYGTSIGAGVDQPLRTATAHAGHHALVGAVVTKFQQNGAGQDPLDPLHTVMSGAPRFGLVGAHLAQVTRSSNRGVAPIDAPAPTITCAKGGEHAVVAATIAQHYGTSTAREAADPMATITTRGTQQGLIAALIAQHNTGVIGRGAAEPFSTILTAGCHQQLVAATLSDVDRAGAERVAAFLLHYYSHGRQAQSLREPLGAVPTRDRFALVTVAGVPMPIVDITMRMLKPAELQAAQGFPAEYDMTDAGRLGKTSQVRLIGNSVCPAMAEAVLRAVFRVPAAERRAA